MCVCARTRVSERLGVGGLLKDGARETPNFGGPLKGSFSSPNKDYLICNRCIHCEKTGPTDGLEDTAGAERAKGSRATAF